MKASPSATSPRFASFPSAAPSPSKSPCESAASIFKILHVDSTTSIAQAGVLGDSYVDITSAHATGPQPTNNTELASIEASSLQGVISASQASIEEITKLMHNANKLVDTLNSTHGTIGGLINDPAFYAKLNHIAEQSR